MTVSVYLAKALICIAGECFPALVGASTPIGSFPLIQRVVESEGYGGDVMQFHQEGGDVLAVHRLWLGSPAQRRPQRLASDDPKQRLITNGCINVSPEVYELVMMYDSIDIMP